MEVHVFDERRFYTTAEIEAVIGKKRRATEAWLGRENVTPYRFSKKDKRFLGCELNEALRRAARRAPCAPSGAVALQAKKGARGTVPTMEGKPPLLKDGRS
jgi:hypothetical protein